MSEYGVALPKGWAVMLKQAGVVLGESEATPSPHCWAPNVVVVALANKMARMIWALLAYGRTFQRGYGRAMAPTAA